MATTESISVNSSGYQHYVLSFSPQRSRYLRPINESLFVRDVAELDAYKNQFQSLIRVLRDSHGNLDYLSQELRQFADSGLIVKALYTIVQSIGCILDLSMDVQAARKNFGQRFEDFVRAILSSLGIVNASFTFSARIPSINASYNVPLDIIMNTKGLLHSSRSQMDARDTILAVKTSSKDRMKLIFVDRFVLAKVLDSQQINYIALYHNDVQRKGTSGVSSTFSSEIYLVFCHIFGDLPLYYLDPPVVASESRFYQKIKTFDAFILHDLWNL